MAKRSSKQQNLFKLIQVFVVAFFVILVLGMVSYLKKSTANQDQAEVQVETEEQQRLRFIKEIAPIVQTNKTAPVFSSVIIAQAALESDFGRSGLAQSYHNLFGVKGSDDSNSKELETQEYVDGEWITIKDKFRVYESYGESIADHSDLFVNGTTWNPAQYQDVLNAKTYQEMAQALQTDGYATDPDYTDKVISLIEEYNLTKYD